MNPVANAVMKPETDMGINSVADCRALMPTTFWKLRCQPLHQHAIIVISAVQPHSRSIAGAVFNTALALGVSVGLAVESAVATTQPTLGQYEGVCRVSLRIWFSNPAVLQ